MKYTRQEHSNFLEEELQAQTKAFNQKLNTSAKFLLQEREELFVAQFLTFKDGEMILKFSTKRGLPRKGEYLYCFTVPKELRDFRNWGEKTYGDLVKEKANFTETVCVWQAPSKDKDGNLEKDFYIAGFRGVEIEFSVNISEAEKMILLLGPNRPPFEYIANLQKIVQNNYSENVSSILDQDFLKTNWQPSLLDNKNDIPNFILSQLSLTDQVVLIGPPGTGKTYQIAEICKRLCEQGNSVLVTSLTNRALIEVVEKPALSSLLDNGMIFKTKISTDEKNEFPKLQPTKEINPQPNNLVLSTFFIASSEAAKLNDKPPFDYVIVDEASQGLLAMFGAAKLLGKKNIWIGDTKQLPPVVAINDDKVSKKNYDFLVDGLKALSDTSSVPIFQLTETYRLPKRGSDYTGIFYNNSLKSRAKKEIRLSFPEIPDDINVFFNPQGGSTLIKADLEVGNKKPSTAIEIARMLVSHLLKVKENLHISVLSNYIDTVKALQKNIYGSIENPKNLLIETVARIQGLTTDITIFVIPNSGYNHSLEKRLFNVATSRSKRHTIIIADKDIISSYPHLDEDVKMYIQKLNDEYSFYYTTDKKLIASKTSEKNEPQVEEKLESQTGLKVLGKIDLSKFEKPKKEIVEGKENIYIIDTNVFVDQPNIISKIDKQYQVVLSAKVIDELDKLKVTLPTEQQKQNVQKAIKQINDSFDKRNIKMDTADLTLLPSDFDKKSPDNFILTVALKYKDENPIMLTSDNGLQLKSKGFGITTIKLKDFLKQMKY
ncbi:MAG: PIN domain-containing protein [Bacteroidales bacterium]|nr:PIN domain-containing protein [Bacteroidales bacterium]